MDEEYCEGCGQGLPKGVLSMIAGGQKVIKLDGKPYCGKCAKIIVDKKRSKLNG